MDKTFYIVPDSQNYYEAIMAPTAEDALASFAENMDTDMSAYFRAVDTEPEVYPHGYVLPDGKFQMAMTIITAVMRNDKDSEWYRKGCADTLNLSNIAVVMNIQKAYDLLCRIDTQMVLATDGSFYKLLKKLTGFSFKAHGRGLDPDEKVCVYVGDAFVDALKVLNHEIIPYEASKGPGAKTIQDPYTHISIYRRHLDRAIKVLEKAGIKGEVDNKGKTLIVEYIDWDDSEKKECPKNLPEKVKISEPDESLLKDLYGNADNLAEYLQEKYHCSVRGLSARLEDNDD